MEQNNINFFRSISGRITIQVLLVCAMVFLFSFIIFFEISVKKVENETVLHAHSELSSTISKIENILLSLEVAVQNTSFQVEEHLKNPESLYEITQKLVSANYFISGSAIAFEPYYFKDKGEYFSPYSYMDSEGKIQTIQMGGFDYVLTTVTLTDVFALMKRDRSLTVIRSCISTRAISRSMASL